MRFQKWNLMFLQAGLAVLDEKYSAYDMNDPVKMAKILAQQKPNWEPGKLLKYFRKSRFNEPQFHIKIGKWIS